MNKNAEDNRRRVRKFHELHPEKQREYYLNKVEKLGREELNKRQREIYAKDKEKWRAYHLKRYHKNKKGLCSICKFLIEVEDNL